MRRHRTGRRMGVEDATGRIEEGRGRGEQAQKIVRQLQCRRLGLDSTVMVGPKIQPIWIGPCRVIGQLGEHSFLVNVGTHETTEVHTDQMKQGLTHPLVESAYPIFRKGGPQVSSFESLVKRVVDIRSTPEGFEFLIAWKDEGGGGQNWESQQMLGPVRVQAVSKLTIRPSTDA